MELACRTGRQGPGAEVSEAADDRTRRARPSRGLGGRYDEARTLYERALAIYDTLPPPEHPRAALVRENHAALLEKISTKAR
jgi:hypothetical protein